MPFGIEVTDDGSFSCRDEATGELYHNIAGAYTEAEKNYAEPGLAVSSPGELRVLDVCFGLGYNSFALIEQALNKKPGIEKISVVALEFDASIIRFMPQVLEQPFFSSLLAALEKSGYERTSIKNFDTYRFTAANFAGEIELVKGDIRELLPAYEKAGRVFDLIFHDPFSPKKVPSLWTIDIFKIYARLLSENGSVLTYSSSSAVRNALEQAGLHVYRTAAVGGKSGGTLASKRDRAPNEFLFQLDKEECEKIQGRKGVPYRDPQFNLSDQEILKVRLAEQDSLFPQ